MKCQLCGRKIEEIYLKKILGTMVKKDKKKYYVCSGCQKIHKENLVAQLP